MTILHYSVTESGPKYVQEIQRIGTVSIKMSKHSVNDLHLKKADSPSCRVIFLNKATLTLYQSILCTKINYFLLANNHLCAQISTMLSSPHKYPSSWLPSCHSSLWSSHIPSCRGTVFPKSIIQMLALPNASWTNNRELPITWT